MTNWESNSRQHGLSENWLSENRLAGREFLESMQDVDTRARCDYRCNFKIVPPHLPQRVLDVSHSRSTLLGCVSLEHLRRGDPPAVQQLPRLASRPVLVLDGLDGVARVGDFPLRVREARDRFGKVLLPARGRYGKLLEAFFCAGRATVPC